VLQEDGPKLVLNNYSGKPRIELMGGHGSDPVAGDSAYINVNDSDDCACVEMGGGGGYGGYAVLYAPHPTRHSTPVARVWISATGKSGYEGPSILLSDYLG